MRAVSRNLSCAGITKTRLSRGEESREKREMGLMHFSRTTTHNLRNISSSSRYSENFGKGPRARARANLEYGTLYSGKHSREYALSEDFESNARDKIVNCNFATSAWRWREEERDRINRKTKGGKSRQVEIALRKIFSFGGK